MGKRAHQHRGGRRPSGFSLIELIIVVVLLGILGVVVANQFGIGATQNATAEVLYDAANKIAGSWKVVNYTAGTSTAVTSPVSTTGDAAGALGVVMEGAVDVAAAYQDAYTRSGVVPLRDLGTGAAGAWQIRGYTLTIAGGGTNRLQVIYAAVPNEVIQILVTKYGSGVSPLAASDAADPVIQYGVDAGAGTRTLTIQRTM